MTKTNSLRSRLARAALLPCVLGATLGACDILDVDNPNNLLEEDIQQVSAANAVVNGALSVVSIAIARTWQPVGIAADELVFIGSRDAWRSLDWGFLSDPDNEFTNENFPFLGRGRWMADEAETILAAHVAATPTNALRRDLARAHLFSALMYTVLGETQEDFTLSHKQEPGPPIGPANMHRMLDDAIAKLDQAVALATAINDSELLNRALGMRARAKHSRAIWSKIKPTPQTADPLVSAAGAVADAQALLARVSDDWTWKLQFSSGTISNEMAAWMNSRGENQFDTLTVINVAQSNPRNIISVRLQDPIDEVPDPVILAKLTEWKGGPITGTGNIYPPLTVTSARHMHLILAEDALQRGDEPEFRNRINMVRAMDDLTPYTGQIPALDMLLHARRVNLFLMGLRLNDMYRFGIADPHWQAGSDAVTRPGTLLPITDIEIRSNPHLR
jgi:starch-binding outer membrane protein, SusD/RagB family